MNSTLSKRTTIHDIAREAGVTKVTVSLALSGKGRVAESTRRKIGRIARRLNYAPNPHARSLSNGRSDVISLFTTNWYPGVISQKIEAIQSLLNERGYDVPIHGYGFRRAGEASTQAAIIRSLRSQRPRAIVCYTGTLEDELARELKSYQDEGGVVLCYGDEVSLACDQVVFDYSSSIYAATRHLSELGHRRIGFFNPGSKANADDEVRTRGWLRALKESKIAQKKQWVFDGEPFEEGGANMAEQFLKLRERPTGLVIVNDVSASTFINALLRAGLKVPQDVSVVGQDDTAAARYCIVPLTTVCQPVEAIAREVVEMLVSRIEGSYDGEARRVDIEGKLVVRASSAPPKS